jgi:site-specific DNA-cytosine methylase
MYVNLKKLEHSAKAIEYMNRKRKDGRTGWDFHHHSDIRNEKSSAVVANFFKGVPYNVFKDWNVIRKYHPIECERLQTLPDNYTEGVSNTQRYKMIGNGWTIEVIAHILKYIKK